MHTSTPASVGRCTCLVAPNAAPPVLVTMQAAGGRICVRNGHHHPPKEPQGTLHRFTFAIDVLSPGGRLAARGMLRCAAAVLQAQPTPIPWLYTNLK